VRGKAHADLRYWTLIGRIRIGHDSISTARHCHDLVAKWSARKQPHHICNECQLEQRMQRIGWADSAGTSQAEPASFENGQVWTPIEMWTPQGLRHHCRLVTETS
jgi:hypothetical protein